MRKFKLERMSLLWQQIAGSKQSYGNYSGVTWQEFVSYDKNNLAYYGLDAPVAVSVDYEVTETAEEDDEEAAEETKVAKNVVFYIGKQNEAGDYYAMLKDGKYIYYKYPQLQQKAL